MIPTKSRKLKLAKLPKNLERIYKQTKCRDCTVKVTRMDFAKILGKFTKVKIQFETNSTPKAKESFQPTPNSRIRNNENGMVQIHRSAYNLHPAKKLLGITKKSRSNNNMSHRPTTNVLKENNRLKKTDKVNVNIEDEYNIEKASVSDLKHYGIVFLNPEYKDKEVISTISLDTILPGIDSIVLPSKDWCIDFFPKKGEPKNDKIYNRIFAELEDLMNNEKTKSDSNIKDEKNDEFPSILDILNDNSKDADKTNDINISGQLESSDVEAMLLGKSKSTESISLNIATKEDTSSLTEGVQKSNDLNTDKVSCKTQETSVPEENPNSPSILNENSQEEVPTLSIADIPISSTAVTDSVSAQTTDSNDGNDCKNKNNVKTEVTQVIFNKNINGTSSKTVMCPKNLKYSITIQGKAIELLGAPKFISCLEDLQVLLEIVEETELTSSHVLH